MKKKLTSGMDRIGYVFIHGAGLGSHIWQEVMNNMDAPCLSLTLPGRGKDAGAGNGEKPLSLTDYLDYIKQQIERWPVDKFIIVAHSIGGLLGLPLCASLADRAVGFAAISAAIPKGGKGSFLSCLPFPQKQIMSLILRKAGTKPPEKQIRSGLCNDLPAEISDTVVHSFVPESVRLYTDAIESGIPELPKLYVQCLQDREFGMPLQKKYAGHLQSHMVKTLNTGHLPMLSDPVGLSEVLQQFGRTVKLGA